MHERLVGTSKMMPRILVTGATGFIGSKLMGALGERAYGISRREGSLQDRNFCKRQVEGVDTLVHLGWSSVPQSAEASPVTDISENAIGAVTLFEACACVGVRRIVFMSTGGTVYGEAKPKLIDENQPLQPICSYGITKVMVENYIRNFRRNYGIEFVVLRGANVYGPGQRHKSGQGVIATWLEKISCNESVLFYGDQSVIRDFVYIDDLVRALVLAIDSVEPELVANIGSGTGHSLDEVLETIRKVVGIDFECIQGKSRKFDLPRNVLDCSVAKKTLNWEPQIELREGIERTWKWWRELNQK